MLKLLFYVCFFLLATPISTKLFLLQFYDQFSAARLSAALLFRGCLIIKCKGFLLLILTLCTRNMLLKGIVVFILIINFMSLYVVFNHPFLWNCH